ncbi:hypothetical protein [Rhizobium sp. P38BS-XIX]|uniref:hypothetical protein n=1 Tax=Rhizobium sp. P38BS-XIX TaxID=2726740 RepID=UPI001FF01092|nr:hypothetical protein [Rhizobium sp. P38BS-XIX]
MFEIREAARLFVARENAKGGLQWQVLDPNPKILVPRCDVPLKAEWTPKNLGRSMRSVTVVCGKARPNDVMPRWNVYVSVRKI